MMAPVSLGYLFARLRRAYPDCLNYFNLYFPDTEEGNDAIKEIFDRVSKEKQLELLSLFPMHERSAFLKRMLENEVFIEGGVPWTEFLKLLPEGGFYYLQEMGDDFCISLSDEESIDWLRDILLVVPTDKHADLIELIGREYIYKRIVEGEALADFLGGFTVEQAWNLVNVIYFDIEEHRDEFNTISQKAQQLVLIMKQLGAYGYTLLRNYNPCNINDFSELECLINWLKEEAQNLTSRQNPEAYNQVLNDFSNLLICLDLRELTASVPPFRLDAAYMKLIKYAGNHCKVILDTLGTGFIKFWSQLEKVGIYFEFHELINIMPDSQLCDLIVNPQQLSKVLESLFVERVQSFLKCINDTDFYRKVIKNKADADNVLAHIKTALTEFSEYYAPIKQTPLIEVHRDIVLSFLTGEESGIKMAEIQACIDSGLRSKASEPRCATVFSRRVILPHREAPARGGAGESKDPKP